MQSGDDAARGLAQRDAGGEVHTVPKVAFGHVGGAPSCGHPGKARVVDRTRGPNCRVNTGELSIRTVVS
jgi:hypothetical protein